MINLINFDYELNLISNIWLKHFIDFCLLLAIEDILFILIVIYILSFSIINSFLHFKKKIYLKILFPIKTIYDFCLIYLFFKLIFLINKFYIANFIEDYGGLSGIIIFIVWLLFHILSILLLPLIYIKISNKII